jgi:hypothetical protein
VDIGVVWGKCVGVGMDFALKGNWRSNAAKKGKNNVRVSDGREGGLNCHGFRILVTWTENGVFERGSLTWTKITLKNIRQFVQLDALARSSTGSVCHPSVSHLSTQSEPSGSVKCMAFIF